MSEVALTIAVAVALIWLVTLLPTLIFYGLNFGWVLSMPVVASLYLFNDLDLSVALLERGAFTLEGSNLPESLSF